MDGSPLQCVWSADSAWRLKQTKLEAESNNATKMRLQKQIENYDDIKVV